MTFSTRMNGIRIVDDSHLLKCMDGLSALGARFYIGKHTYCVIQDSNGYVSVSRTDRVFESKRQHGHSKIGGIGSSEYRSWLAMKNRCCNPKHEHYHRYGGRGIKVDPSWNDFNVFLSDMGHKSNDDQTIERTDSDGHYCKSNCRWAGKLEQMNNMSTNVNLTIDGDTRTAQQWSLISGIDAKAIYNRLELGWSHKDAVWKPITKYRTMTFYGKTMSVAEWCKISQVCIGTVNNRLRQGMSDKEAMWTPASTDRKRKKSRMAS